jgi:hypothetical protein
VGKAAPRVLIAGKFLSVSCRGSGKGWVAFSNKAARPDIAKFHKFRVLSVSEIMWVGKYAV